MTSEVKSKVHKHKFEPTGIISVEGDALYICRCGAEGWVERRKKK